MCEQKKKLALQQFFKILFKGNKILRTPTQYE